jgi:hypothetical protein
MQIYYINKKLLTYFVLSTPFKSQGAKITIMSVLQKKSKRRQILKSIVSAIGLVVLVFAIWFWYSSTHPLSNSRFGFQYYKPTNLPAGFHITDKRIDIANPDGQLYGISAELNLRTEDWVYAIRESRANSEASPDSSSTRTNLRNYDPKSVAVTCEEQTSPKGQPYRLCHWIDYGRISVYEVNFVKGGTFINTQLPGTINVVVPVYQISNYVDSFVKASATGFKTVSGL